MSRLPVGPLSERAVADLVEELEQRVDRCQALMLLAPQAYGVEAAVLQTVLNRLEGLLRRPLDA